MSRVHGVDFSGADSGGSAKIVIASVGPEGSVRVRRGIDRAALRRAILESLETAELDEWRIDAPFSVPEAVFERHDIAFEWRALAEWMDGFDTPRDWRRAMREVNRKEPRRTCDRAAHTPLAPMNLRVFKQTWTIVCEILLPLAEAGVHIAPVHPTDAPCIVTEGCPASVLAFRGESSRGYKGRSDDNRERRRGLCDLLGEWGLTVSGADRAAAIRDPEGDVLDAMLLLAPPNQHVPPREARAEAWVW